MPRGQRTSSGSQHHQAYTQQQMSSSLAPPPMYTDPRMPMPPGGPYFEMPGTSGAAPSSSIQLPSQASRELPSTVFDTDGYSTSTAPPVRVPASHRPSSGAWSYSDDQQLVAARSRGLNWNQIKNTHFPSKTANACRKRHERLSEKRDSDEWDNRKFQQLSREYMSMRKEIWSGLAARTGEKWSVVEQKCMSNGLKNIQSASRAASRIERFHNQNIAAAAATGSGPITGYDDDSGISGIALTPVDELDASYSSPETSNSSSSGRGRRAAVPPAHHHYQQQHDTMAHIPASSVSHHHLQVMGDGSAANFLTAYGIPPNGMGDPYNTGRQAMGNHRYSSSVSSNASYGANNDPEPTYGSGRQRRLGSK